MEYEKNTTKEEKNIMIVGKGHEDTFNYMVKNDVLVRYNEFENKASSRIEKLVTALYMVTDCIHGDEHLKSNTRSLGVEMLSDIAGLPYHIQGEKYATLESVSRKITELISVMTVAVSVGLVSVMNYTILKREFLRFKDDCDNTKKRESIEDLFSTQIQTNNDQYKNNDLIKDSIVVKDKEKLITNNVLYGATKKMPVASVISQKNLSRALDVGLKIERKNKIIKLIKEKKEVTIKDISTIVSDCSEKTIQRELSALVSQGVLDKKGEKRWSRYSLKVL